MRRLFMLLSALCATLALSAQTPERNVMHDSLAYGSLNRLRFSNAVDNVMYVMNGTDERTVYEYAVFTYAHKQMCDRFSALSDEELLSLVGYVTSEPFRCLNSTSLWSSFVNLLYDVVDSSVGNYPAVRLEVNDKEYADKAERLIEMMGLSDAVSSYVRNCRASMALSLSKGSGYLTAFDRMSRQADKVFVQTLIDYFDHEDLDYLLAYPETETGRKVSDLCGGKIRDFNMFLDVFLADIHHQGYAMTAFRRLDPLYDKIAATEHEVMSIADGAQREDVIDLAVRLREIPFPYKSPRSDTARLELAAGRYEGQVRDGMPHGKGIMTLADGSREVGTYKYGLKNGFVITSSAEKGQVTQVWASGKLVEPQSLGMLADGSVPSVPLVNGMPYGYGACIKGDDTYIGHFVDGRLNGLGSITGPDDLDPICEEKVVYGTFCNDRCEKGTRLQKYKSGRREFKGKFYHDDCLEGELSYYDSLGAVRRYRKGFITYNDMLDGPGIDIVRMDSLSTERRGTFVKGHLYGDAVNVRTILLENGMTSSLRVEGLFWMDSPWQIRRTVETFTGIPVEAGKARVLRSCGVRIVTRGTDSLSVTCEGTFGDDSLLEGRVSVSDGTWMEGEFSGGVQLNGTTRAVDKYSTIYEGEVKDGNYHGQGKCIYKDGTYFVGRFEKGSRRGGKHYSASGKLLKVLPD